MSMMIILGRHLRRFLANESGSAGSEFVVSLPLLIGVMVIASEYGGALQVRDVLDAATRDASRFLARAPLDSSGQLQTHFETEAKEMVADRLGVAPGEITFNTSIAEVPGTSGAFRTDYRVVEVDVAVQVPMPLLALLDIYSGVDRSSVPAINMFANDTARYTGEVPPSETTACNWVMRYNSDC